MNKNYEKFMLDSNKIEGEDRINPGDLEALKFIINPEISESLITHIHEILGKYLDVDWTGRYRACRVRVGQYIPPEPYMVPELMTDYFKKLPKMDSFIAYNEFEKIHAFRDLNGRVGRLIWLKKAIDEGYNFKIPFLHLYHYQALNHYHS